MLGNIGSSLVTFKDYVKRSLKSFLPYPKLYLVVSANLWW